MTKTVTPHSILATHYGTHTANRKTSCEEFNKDSERMSKAKLLWLRSEEKWRDEPNEYRRSIANILKRKAFKLSAELKLKTWGK